jgi:hypothetical protein
MVEPAAGRNAGDAGKAILLATGSRPRCLSSVTVNRLSDRKAVSAPTVAVKCPEPTPVPNPKGDFIFIS